LAQFRPVLKDPSPSRWIIQTELHVQYEITESPNLLNPNNPRLLAVPGDLTSSGTRLVVLDHSISELYGDRVRAYFEANQVAVEYLVLTGAEEDKSIEQVLEVISRLNEVGTNRLSSPPIAIGGGVLADVVGLAASLYRRGIPYVRVPTTLLGQVDVSVAAKTGVNFGGYRNRLGSYSPPPYTLIDRAFLATVPERHIRNGLGEILKMAMIKDLRLFELLEEHGADLVDTRFQKKTRTESGEIVADEVIGRSIAGMAQELASNLWEKNLQRSVDYGHSFSPLVEMRALPELLHGEAVAMDCVFSAVIAAGRGLISAHTLERIVAVTRRLGLRPSHPLFCDVGLLSHALADTVRHRDGHQHLPMLTEIGQVCFINDVTGVDLVRAAEVMQHLLDEDYRPVEAEAAR
jgi:2-epi-5-epi-valiolone synthase